MPYVTDPFTGTGALSANWTIQVSTVNTMERSSDVCIPHAVGGGDSQYYYSGQALNGNMWAECKIVTFNSGGAGGSRGMGPAVRMSSTQKTFYSVIVNEVASDNIWISKKVNGTQTDITSRTATVNSGDVLRIAVYGSRIQVFLNGVQLGADITDTDIPATASPAYAGLWYSSTMVSASVDDFKANNFRWILGTH